MSNKNWNVLSEEQFKYLLEHECKRAQRYQYFFSLLIIKVENANLKTTLLREIPNIINNAIRDCDTMGAIQYNKLAIILCFADKPNTITRRILNKIQYDIPGINVKAGEVCFPLSATTAADLFRECDDHIF